MYKRTKYFTNIIENIIIISSHVMCKFYYKKKTRLWHWLNLIKRSIKVYFIYLEIFGNRIAVEVEF